MSNNISTLHQKLISSDSATVYDALIDIGKGFHKKLEKDVAVFLTHDDIELRAAAIQVLGFYWKLPEYKEAAQQMFLNDKDDWVRAVALMAWSSYFEGLNNKSVMQELFKVLENKEEDFIVRTNAHTGILTISGLPKTEWPKTTLDDPDEDIDWDLIRGLIEQA